jgi:hypothetical protein
MCYWSRPTENAKLKRMYADLALENAAIKDVPRRGDAPMGQRALRTD